MSGTSERVLSRKAGPASCPRHRDQARPGETAECGRCVLCRTTFGGEAMTVRALEPSDAAAAAALIRAAFSAIREPLDPRPSALQEMEASILAHLSSGGGGAVVVRAGLAAVVLWSEQDGGLYLGRLAVAPHCQGQGVATALMHEAEAETRRRGLPRLHLGVRLALPGNRRLFARLGFVETTRHAHAGHSEPTWTEAEKWLVTAPPPETGTPPGSPNGPRPAAPSSGRCRA